jgi:hypothetical protein
VDTLRRLKRLAQDLKLAGEDELADKVACALSALAGTKEPKAELSYSYMLRKLRKGDKERLRKFQVVFKNNFDAAMSESLSDPESIALMAALRAVDLED